MIPFPMAFNQSCYGIRAKEDIDSTFLYYLIKNSVRKLKVMTHGSVFDTITKDTFANIEVDIPDIETQHRIAKMLAVIDDKVENNQRINNNLVAYKLMLDTSSFPDISFGKRASRIFVSLCDSRVRFFICRNIGCTMSSKRRSVSVSGNIVGYALRISVFRLLKTLPLLRLISC